MKMESLKDMWADAKVLASMLKRVVRTSETVYMVFAAGAQPSPVISILCKYGISFNNVGSKELKGSVIGVDSSVYSGNMLLNMMKKIIYSGRLPVQMRAPRDAKQLIKQYERARAKMCRVSESADDIRSQSRALKVR